MTCIARSESLQVEEVYCKKTINAVMTLHAAIGVRVKSRFVDRVKRMKTDPFAVMSAEEREADDLDTVSGIMGMKQLAIDANEGDDSNRRPDSVPYDGGDIVEVSGQTHAVVTTLADIRTNQDFSEPCFSVSFCGSLPEAEEYVEREIPGSVYQDYPVEIVRMYEWIYPQHVPGRDGSDIGTDASGNTLRAPRYNDKDLQALMDRRREEIQQFRPYQREAKARALEAGSDDNGNGSDNAKLTLADESEQSPVPLQ
jgi:hypothetical protein